MFPASSLARFLAVTASVLGIALPVTSAVGAPAAVMATIHYQLPATGPLPRTYLVTLAITDPHDSNWIVSNFASGIVRTVTAENQGRFAEGWDGLDDNYMPVPPGSYGVKGIFSPAQKWAIDGQYHAVVPKLAATGCSWGQSPAEDTQPGKIDGDPVGGPLRDVDIAANGTGVLAFEYMENGRNYYLTDFTKPIGSAQIVTGFDSGVFAGATSICTDGKESWCFSTDGGVGFIACADGRPFGHQRTGRDNVYIPGGWVTGLAAWLDPARSREVIFAAEGAKTPGTDQAQDAKSRSVDAVLALDSQGAATLASWKVRHPLGVAVRGRRLYILHAAGAGCEVLALPLTAGWERAQPTLLFAVPREIHPFDIQADSRGRIYLSDPGASRVIQFDASGHLLATYGRPQVPGPYDPQALMAPEKLASWTDAQGHDRLVIVEMAGPNRLSEWSGDTGELLRQWVVPQTYANGGLAIDPRHPNLLYLRGQRDSLVRWKIDYATGEWKADAVWPEIEAGFHHLLTHELALPRIVYPGDAAYLVFGEGYAVFRLEGDRLRACAALLEERTAPDHVDDYIWRDVNGNGQVEPREYRPYRTTFPPGILRYFGQTWFDDLSLVCLDHDSSDIWRLSPTGFDSHGTPAYDPAGWFKLLSDDVFLARKAGTATALRGGNEIADGFNSDWASIVGQIGGDLYVSARSGFDYSANQGAQYKLSRYTPDGRGGGYHQRWRVGRVALKGAAMPGQVYSPLFLSAPLNGLVPVVDNSRAGVVLYNEEGLYVDTLFPDEHLMPAQNMGAYWQPGEFFAGNTYANRDNGKIYFAMGKTMPQLYEAQGWSLTVNPARPIPTVDSSVLLTADEIGTPPDAALQLRGGMPSSGLARFYPSPGSPPALDGSLRGWETGEPLTFSDGPVHTVEVRCLYDPQHLYLRWHVRLGHDVGIPTLGDPAHLFAHEHAADTLGLYLQGDPHAAPGGLLPDGRPGDVRFVFGLFRDNGSSRPVVIGMYPSWKNPGSRPHAYHTPQGGSIRFAHVGLVPEATAGYRLDDDHQGFTLAAAIPRAAIPGAPVLDGWHTEANFDANLGGHDRFWWSNADGSASRETFDEPTEARFFPGSWSPLRCLPMTALPIRSWMAIGPFGSPDVDRLDFDRDRTKVETTLFAAKFPPDSVRDLEAVYDGELTHTRTAQRKLGWRPCDLAGDFIDVSHVLGWEGKFEEGVTYLLTHIYSPESVDVAWHAAEPDGEYALHAQLNGKTIKVTPPSTQYSVHPEPAEPLHLQQGWNELLLRRDYIWGDLTFGATLQADPAVLWKLRISGPAPK